MGNLPRDRLHGNRPFEVSGVDLFGPVKVSLGIRGKQPIKMYIAVFVGRRGPVVKLYCDNATNFVGAARILKELLEPVDTNDQSIMSYAAAHRFTIEFIPPRAPHIGGLWEAAVKSAKHLLLRAMGRAILKEDELHTVIVEVEAVLNSRPLIVDSGSPNEGEVVTPAHLLVGTTLATMPMAASLSNQTAVLERLVEGLSFEPTAAREMDQRRGHPSDRNSGGNPRRQRSPPAVDNRHSRRGHSRT
nr:uncharacterized protein LOC123002448 [Drosophila takahashii]